MDTSIEIDMESQPFCMQCGEELTDYADVEYGVCLDCREDAEFESALDLGDE